jgi:hypothetical protein
MDVEVKCEMHIHTKKTQLARKVTRKVYASMERESESKRAKKREIVGVALVKLRGTARDSFVLNSLGSQLSYGKKSIS